jgi:hypothetical protein
LTPLPNLESTSNSKRESSRSASSCSLTDIRRQTSFQRAAPLCWGVKTSLSRLELKKPLYRRNPGRCHSRSTLESVKTSLWTFSSGGTGNETHRVESRVDALPRLEAVGFGGNATPRGISTRIALVGLTVRSRTRDCAQPPLSETFKVGRPFSATNSFETSTHWKISQRNQCFTSQRTVHQPVVNLERIASQFIPPLKRWAFSVFCCKKLTFRYPCCFGSPVTEQESSAA